MKERVSFIKDFFEKCLYFYEAPAQFDENVIKKRWKKDTSAQLTRLKKEFSNLENPSKEDYERVLKKTAEHLGIGNGKLIHPLRLSVSGVGSGPGVFDIVDTIGKDETIRRIEYALNVISSPDSGSQN
jgi:glutamyl-tRNA synthetase